MLTAEQVFRTLGEMEAAVHEAFSRFKSAGEAFTPEFRESLLRIEGGSRTLLDEMVRLPKEAK